MIKQIHQSHGCHTTSPIHESPFYPVFLFFLPPFAAFSPSNFLFPLGTHDAQYHLPVGAVLMPKHRP
jgi:hypothetical protein